MSDIKLFNRPLKFGTKGKLYQNLSDPGSMLFGGAGVSNSLGQERNGGKSGLLGDQQQGIDWFGSPITAGTDLQPYARGAALIYGAAAGASALGAGSAGASGAGAAGAEGATAGGAAGTAGTAGTSGGGGAAVSSTPGWMNYARMGANAMASQKPQQPQFQRATMSSLMVAPPGESAPATAFNPNAPQPGIPASQYDLMLSLADTGIKEKQLKEQFKLAEELRGTELPSGRHTGRSFVAAHPLEFANTAIRQGIGYKQRKETMTSQEELAKEIRRRIQEEREKQRRQQSGQPGFAVPSTIEA